MTVRRRIHIQQAPEVTIGETEPPPPPLDGDLDILFLESFDLADVLAGTLGPIQTQDTIDISDDPDVGPITVQESFTVSALHTLEALTPVATDTIDISDEMNETLTLANFLDTVDATDDPFADLVLLDSLDTDDAAFIDAGTITPVDTFTLTDARGEATMDSTQLDSWDMDDELGTSDLAVAEGISAFDVIVPTTVTALDWAENVISSSSVTNPNNILGNTTSTAATVPSVGSGIGTPPTVNFSIVVDFGDLDITDLFGDWTSGEVELEWQMAVTGVPVGATASWTIEYSPDNGTSWNTVGTETDAAAVAKHLEEYVATGFLVDEADWNGSRVRISGTIDGGTVPLTGITLNLFRVNVNASQTVGAVTPPSFIAQTNTQGDSASTNSITIDVPSGTAQNDLLLAAFSMHGNQDVNSVPSGWTLELEVLDPGAGQNDAHMYIYRRVAGASEPSDYTWGFTGNAFRCGCMITYRGVDTTTPVETSDGDYVNGNSAPIAAPSVTTANNGSLVVGFWSSLGAAGSSSPYNWTAPAGMTERVDADNGSTLGSSIRSIYACDEVQAIAGSTGTNTPTWDQPDCQGHASAHVVVNPA